MQDVRIEEIIRNHCHVCWYPSAGVDFRPMLYFSDMFYEYAAGKGEERYLIRLYEKGRDLAMPVYSESADRILPDLFVMTDHNPTTFVWNGRWQAGLSINDRIHKGTDVPLFMGDGWRNVKTLFCDGDRTRVEVAGHPRQCADGKAFFMKVHVVSRLRGVWHEWDTELLYCIMDNMDFVRGHLLGKSTLSNIETVVNIRMEQFMPVAMEMQELFPALGTRYYVAEEQYVQALLQSQGEPHGFRSFYRSPSELWSGRGDVIWCKRQ